MSKSQVNGEPHPGAKDREDHAPTERSSPSCPDSEPDTSTSHENASMNSKKRKSSATDGGIDGHDLGSSQPEKKSPRLEGVTRNQIPPQRTAQADGEPSSPYYDRDPLSPLRQQDVNAWPGYREIETDADVFQSMLGKLGADDLVVQHVFGLESEDLKELPQPIVGFLFCFRHRCDDDASQVESCPNNIWFANQTHRWLCGSNSLLNIIFNIPNLGLGEHLEAFRDFTRELTPAQRGDAVGNFEFLRRVHNSGLRKMEILLGDVALMEEYNNRKPIKKAAPSPETKVVSKGKANGKTKSKPKKKTVADEDSDSDDTAYHYAAYLPIEGTVWKLDGLDRQPCKLDKCDDGDWARVAARILAQRIAEVDDEGSASILAICRKEDRAKQLRRQLADKVPSLNIILGTLGSSADVTEDDRAKAQDAIRGPNSDLSLTEDNINKASAISKEVINASTTGDHEKLRSLRDSILSEQQRLTNEISQEVDSHSDDEERLKATQHDYEPLVRTWLEMLANKEGVLRELIESAA